MRSSCACSTITAPSSSAPMDPGPAWATSWPWSRTTSARWSTCSTMRSSCARAASWAAGQSMRGDEAARAGGAPPMIGAPMLIRPSLAARLSYAALFGAVGASFPYLPVFYQTRGLDLATVGLLTAFGAAVGLLAAPIWGAIADRYAGSRLIIPVAALTAGVGAIGLAVVDGVGAMAVALAVMSGAFAGIAPTLDARALETVGSDRNRYGRLRAWGSASFIVVVVITGALIQRVG